ncbi:hypothetical protein HK096_005500 [Nowakowskiella sp. JEL0078]|nr:hypothetical protein HK096_005500 [Nowakowskiella sp. JEL0078]
MKEYVYNSYDITLESEGKSENPKGSELESHFMANINGRSHKLTNLSLLHLILSYPLAALLVVPRIMYQAWVLAYKKRLKVYQRPNPTRGMQQISGTIVRKKMTSFDKIAVKLTLQHLKVQCDIYSTSMSLHLPDSTIINIPNKTNESTASPIVLHFPSFQFFRTFVLDGEHIARAISVAFIRGDFVCTSSDLSKFISVLKQSETKSEQFCQLGGWVKAIRNWLNNEAIRSPFEKHKFAYMDHDWTLEEIAILGSEAAETKLEEWLFKKIADFVWDPLRIQERIIEYAIDWQKGVFGMDLVSFQTDADSIIGDFSDDVPHEKREKLRFRELIKYCHI